MAWFNRLSYKALEHWVPTMGVVPAKAVHAVARLKGAILRDLLAAKEAGDMVVWQRGWKAITFLDRMLFAQSRGDSAKEQTKAELVTARVRRAWRGDWDSLFAEAAAASRRRGDTEMDTVTATAAAGDVRAVEAYVAEGLLAKAVSRVRGGLQIAARSVGSLEGSYARGGSN